MVTSERRVRKRAAARDRIVKAAIDLFAVRGIDAVTVDQIARAADVGKGTIYTHFPTKEAIIVAFMADMERKVQAKLRAFQVSDQPPAEVLAEFVRLQWRMKRPHHRFVRVFFAQMFLHTDAFLPFMAEIHGLMAPNLAGLFAALQRRRVVRADVPAEELALLFGNLQFGLTAQWAIEGPPFRGADHVLERAVAMFCAGALEREL